MERHVSRPYGLIRQEDAVLVIIDAQDRLLPAIENNGAIVQNTLRLVKFCRLVGIPIVITEQEKLGPTLPEILRETAGTVPLTKIHFNCYLNTSFREEMERLRRSTVILAGVEAHICVAQTAIHALSSATVHVVADATGSRRSENRAIALERMRQAGVIITSTEMFLYEIMERAGTDLFKRTLSLVK